MTRFERARLVSGSGKRARCVAFVLSAFLISGCGIFGGKKDEELEPVELVDINETLDVRRLWSENVGKGSEFLRLGLSPGGDGNRIYAAGYDGKVTAFDPANGRQVWQVETEMTLSAGPGVGDGLVVVVSSDGDLVSFGADDGSERWRTSLDSESLSPPLVGDGAVIVYSVDGRLRVFSSATGREEWSLEQTLPALTQRGSTVPVIVGDTIVAGFDNGRLIATDIDDGIQIWEAVLTPPSGRSDLDRLADVDGAIAAVGQDVYASSYNGRVAALAAESGDVLWAREISTQSGISADWNNVYTVGAEGEIIALLRRTGADVWRQDSLLHREPTTPVAFGTSIVVGDFEGYVHFFSNIDGQPVARERVGKGMISGMPFVMGDKLFVQSESGALAAFAVRTPERAEDDEGSDEDEDENDGSDDSTSDPS